MIHTKRQMADYTAKAMKRVDLNPGMKTYGMYVTGKKTMADMDDTYLRRNLCAKAGGNVCVCASCPAVCTVGKLLLERRATP